MGKRPDLDPGERAVSFMVLALDFECFAGRILPAPPQALFWATALPLPERAPVVKLALTIMQRHAVFTCSLGASTGYSRTMRCTDGISFRFFLVGYVWVPRSMAQHGWNFFCMVPRSPENFG